MYQQRVHFPDQYQKLSSNLQLSIKSLQALTHMISSCLLSSSLDDCIKCNAIQLDSIVRNRNIKSIQDQICTVYDQHLFAALPQQEHS